jgi:2'-5' RNA ligase
MDGPVRQEVAAILDRLRGTGADVKWVPPENLHVTLQFLGDVGSERTDELVSLLRGAVEAARAFPVRLAGLGAFPSRGSERVLWAGVARGGEDLARLALRVERVLVPAGFLAPSDRPFRAHVTLGRPKSPRGLGPLRDLLGELRFEGSERLLEEVRLVQSLLSPRGAEYRVVARFPLAPATEREEGEAS